MPKVVSLFLPTWPTDRLRRKLGRQAPPPEAALVMMGRDARRRVVTAADAVARGIGIQAGMAATQAHALVPELVVYDAETEDDAAALERLAIWALRRYAPIVAVDPPDGLMIDAGGVGHLHGGDKAMVEDLVARLGEAGIAARAVMAPSYGSAHAMARYHPVRTQIVADAELTNAIGGLPLVALRLNADIVASLNRLGFETIAELDATPRSPLALRFGSEVGRRLDQAYGRETEVFQPVEASGRIEVIQRFAEPIGAPETLARYTGKLVGQLCEELERQGVGARRLDLRFLRVDNQVEAIRAGTAKPVRDAKRLTRLLTDRLDTVAPGFGIESMILAAPVVEPLAYHTISDLGSAPRADVGALVDILSNRVGEERLYRLTGRYSDVPERSVVKVPPMSDPTAIRWPVHWPRPARMLKHPEPIETMALLPDHPPVHFSWRGTRRRVKRADGPERIYGEWIVSDAEMLGVRDYFLVEDDSGQRYWIFRNGDGADAATGTQDWFLHGLFG